MKGQRFRSYCRFRIKNRARLWAVLMLLCSFLSFSGCSGTNLNSPDKIVPPSQGKSPLEGRWRVVSLVPAQQVSAQNQAAAVPEEYEYVQFLKDMMAAGARSWKDIQYQTKVVDSDAYYMFKRIKGMEELRELNQEIQVVTVTSSDQYVCEFAILSEGKLAGELEGNVLMLEKLSDSVDNQLFTSISMEQVQEIAADPEKKAMVQSGLLLGLRKPGSEDGEQPDSYRTLWIAAENKNLQKVMWMDSILLPRKSGFWKVEVNRILVGDRQEDVISAYRISDDAAVQQQTLFISPPSDGPRPRKTSRSITFVGNDYMAMEISGELHDKSYSRFQMNPVDNLADQQGVKLSDLAGPEAEKTLEAGRNNALLQLAGQGFIPGDADFQEENFSLIRRFGHWFFEGRISGADQEGRPANVDYAITLIPPEKVVFFDTLCVPWTAVKDRVPEAVDAFTSPNRDIAVVITDNRLLVYGIENGMLASKPYRKFKLDEGETVMMAEWARGRYVQSWTKTFGSNPVNEMKSIP